MHVYVPIDQLKGLISYLKNYREKKFVNALISAKKVKWK
jgi:hypothetical protein